MKGFVIVDNTPEINEKVEAALEAAFEVVGLKMESYAKGYLTQKGAIDTGNLRNSATHKSNKTSAYVGTNVEYGI